MKNQISDAPSRLGDDGTVHYSNDEHDVWTQLIARQLKLIPEHACQSYLDGLERLNLCHNHIPELAQLNKPLQAATDWQVQYVPALLHYDDYFALLAKKIFPVAPFIRGLADINTLGECDIFSKVFGVCPLLTDPAFAAFLHGYGKLGSTMNQQQRLCLDRLFWFTAEAGLIDTPQGVRIYGSSLLTCAKAVSWSLQSIAPKREEFDPVLALRTPYRTDILQPLFYVLDSFKTLEQLMAEDMTLMINEAHTSGLLPPLFTDD